MSFFKKRGQGHIFSILKCLGSSSLNWQLKKKKAKQIYRVKSVGKIRHAFINFLNYAGEHAATEALDSRTNEAKVKKKK